MAGTTTAASQAAGAAETCMKMLEDVEQEGALSQYQESPP